MTFCAYEELVALAFEMQIIEMSVWGEINRKKLRTSLRKDHYCTGRQNTSRSGASRASSPLIMQVDARFPFLGALKSVHDASQRGIGSGDVPTQHFFVKSTHDNPPPTFVYGYVDRSCLQCGCCPRTSSLRRCRPTEARSSPSDYFRESRYRRGHPCSIDQQPFLYSCKSLRAC
jgi:hypothetical protein